MAGGAEGFLELLEAQIFFSLISLSHPLPAVLFSVYNMEEKLKMPVEFFLSCPGEEEKTALGVKQSKPPTGYMTPSLHTSFRKDFFLRLL